MPDDIAELERYNRQLKRLVELSVTLNSTLDLNDLLQLITKTATELLACDGASILLYDERLEKLYFAASTGSDPKKLAEIPVPLDGSLAGTIFRTNTPIILNKVEQDPRHYAPSSDRVSMQIRTLVGVPMLIKERMIGVLEGVNKQGGEFVEQDQVILSVIASHAATAINNARLFREAEQRAQNLEALRNINDAVLNNLDLQLTLPQILIHVQARLGVDAADVLLLNKKTNRLIYASGLGFRTDALKNINLKLGQGNAGRVAKSRKMVSIPDLRSSNKSATIVRVKLFEGEGFVGYYAAPLIVKGEVMGVLEVFHRSPLDADHDWLAFFQVIADQTALAIDSATLFSELQLSNADLRHAYDATIEGWSHALDLRDKETEGHSQRVTEMTVKLALLFGVKIEDIVNIRRGSLLHDMGKIAVPDAVLLKPGKLTDDEWLQMRKHPQYAYEMLESIEYLKPALEIPYCHHEKWDGSGYPRGLKGEEIPLSARLFAVVDVWDALRNDRPYRKGWPKAMTISFIKEQSGIHFDPQVVEVFLRLVEDLP